MSQPNASIFAGFPAGGIQFMRDLAANNSKAWFNAHRQAYLDAIQTPAVALVTTLGARLQEHFPEITPDVRTNGSGTLMRIHRDIRFSADKSPYKTNVAMVFTAGPGRKMEAPGFGLQMTLTEVEMEAGIFSFPKPMLDRYRQAVLASAPGRELESAAASVTSATGYTVNGIARKRVPRGFDAGHPRAEWLKYGGLWAGGPAIGLDVAQTPALVDELMDRFLHLAPIYRWVVGHLV